MCFLSSWFIWHQLFCIILALKKEKHQYFYQSVLLLLLIYVYYVRIDFSLYVIFVIMVYFDTAILYYFGTKEGKASKFFSIGALFTTVLIILSSYLFGIYIENFAKYNELYGSIGALLILLFYLWLNS